MSLFTKRVKEVASKNPPGYLQRKYEQSERNLKYHASVGDRKKFKKTMKQHQVIEYAMLYQQTPEFKNKGRCR